MTYIHDVVITTSGYYLPFKFIEALKFDLPEESALVDKLRDDTTFFVRTISGYEYEISISQVAEIFNLRSSKEEIASALLEKWIRVVAEKD